MLLYYLKSRVLNFNFDMPGFGFDRIVAEIWPIKVLAWIHSTQDNSTPVMSRMFFNHCLNLKLTDFCALNWFKLYCDNQFMV